jgi:serine-type D-Ala-D-Ala carboxypeptidase (penicillin-binding protein 5/6)
MQGARRGLTISIAALAAAVCLLAPPGPAGAASAPEPPGRAWLLVDATDGTVLASRAAGREASIASTTKLMTAYVARRDLRLGQEVTAPPYTPTSAESLLGLRTGERIEVRDLLTGMLLVSGNDAAVALAQASAGSVDRFVGEMNRAARRLGLDRTSYANPIGLDEAGNYSTPRDLVTLTLELRDDPFFRRVFNLPQARLRSGAKPRTVVNRNLLVRTVPWVNGVKTGYTLDAGYVLVGSGTRPGVTVVSALLGAPSEAARDAGTLELLRYGLSLYHRERVVARGRRLAVPGVRDQGESLPLVASRSLKLTLRKGERVDREVVAPDEVEGPIDRGEPLGRVVVSVEGEQRGTVPLVAAHAVPSATLLERFDGDIPGPRAFAWVVAIAAVAAVLGGMLAVFDRRRARRAD